MTMWKVLGTLTSISVEVFDPEEIVVQWIDLFGPLPTIWWDSWEAKSRYFETDGRPKEGREVWGPLEKTFEDTVQRYRREGDHGVYGTEEQKAILDLMRCMLALKPEDRPSAQDVMESEWMVRWGLPDLERAESVDPVQRPLVTGSL